MIKPLLNCVAFAIATLTIFETKAQGEAAAILKAGKEDANKVMGAYMDPLFKGFASGANIGWYNTAKPHGTGGFDITFSLGLFTVPSVNQSYTFEELGLGQGPYKFTPEATTNPSSPLPTVFGKNPATPQKYNLDYQFSFDTIIGGINQKIDTTILLAGITMPDGANINFMAALPPSLQFAIGIYKNTEVMVRYLPTINTLGFKANMYGFGVKHSIKQWLPVIKDVPIWDWSFVGGFNSFKSSYTFSESSRLTANPNTEYGKAYNINTFSNKTYDNQRFEFNGNAFMIGTVASIKLGPFTPYLGINYNKATVDFSMRGDYPLLVAETNPTSSEFGKPKIEELSDPLSISSSVSGIRINPGFRLKFLVFTLHYDYSYNTYGFNLHTIGMGINVQSLAPPAL
jgi:hypothetical protein